MDNYSLCYDHCHLFVLYVLVEMNLALVIIGGVLAFLVAKVVKYLLKKPVPNPFATDCRKSPKPIPLNQKQRDAVLKNG